MRKWLFAALRKWRRRLGTTVVRPALRRCIFAGRASACFYSLGNFGRAVAGVANAAGNLADVCANVTIAMADSAIGGLYAAKAAAEEAWRGVDLLNVSTDRLVSKSVGSSPAVLGTWLQRGNDA